MDRNTEITNSQQSIEFSENTNSMDNTLVDEGNSEAVSKLRLVQNVKMMKDEINMNNLMVTSYMTPEQINQLCLMVMTDLDDEPTEEVQRIMKDYLIRLQKRLLEQHFVLVDQKKTEEEKTEARQIMQSIIDEVTLPEWALMIKNMAMEVNPSRARREMNLQYLLDQDDYYQNLMFNLYQNQCNHNLEQEKMMVMEMIMDEYRYY